MMSCNPLTLSILGWYNKIRLRRHLYFCRSIALRNVRDQYELLDFGDGRRLERFGPLVLDRPCPAAEGVACARGNLWAAADARFDGRQQQRGHWTCHRELPDRWTVALAGLQFELKRTDFGHVGLFPEQAENWVWISGQWSVVSCWKGKRGEGRGESEKQRPSTQDLRPKTEIPQSRNPEIPNLQISKSPNLQIPPSPVARLQPPAKVLNLFAYTGGSTLAAAAAGAEVAHVDAAANVVAWARRNAALSGLENAPVRWIVEDAMKFVKRELRRGAAYEAVILDPPSYGHGRRGEVWRLVKHLPRLLKYCAELTAGRRRFMLLTCHTPGFGPDELSDMLIEALDGDGRIDSRVMALETADGRRLHGGVAARWSASPRLQPRPLSQKGEES